MDVGVAVALLLFGGFVGWVFGLAEGLRRGTLFALGKVANELAVYLIDRTLTEAQVRRILDNAARTTTGRIK